MSPVIPTHANATVTAMMAGSAFPVKVLPRKTVAIVPGAEPINVATVNPTNGTDVNAAA